MYQFVYLKNKNLFFRYRKNKPMTVGTDSSTNLHASEIKLQEVRIEYSVLKETDLIDFNEG